MDLTLIDSVIAASIIQALGSIVAASIGVIGVYQILKHRKHVDNLVQEVSAYYYHEEQLVREIYRLNNKDKPELDDGHLSNLRGRLRRDLATDKDRPSMSARNAQKLRGRIL